MSSWLCSLPAVLVAPAAGARGQAPAVVSQAGRVVILEVRFLSSLWMEGVYI